MVDVARRQRSDGRAIRESVRLCIVDPPAGVHEHLQHRRGVATDVHRGGRGVVGGPGELSDHGTEGCFINRERRSDEAVVYVRVGDQPPAATEHGAGLAGAPPPRVIARTSEAKDGSVELVDVLRVPFRRVQPCDPVGKAWEPVDLGEPADPVLDRPGRHPDGRVEAGRDGLERLDDRGSGCITVSRNELLQQSATDASPLQGGQDEEERQEPIGVAPERSGEGDGLRTTSRDQGAIGIGLKEVAQYRSEPVRVGGVLDRQPIPAMKIAVGDVEDRLTRRDVRVRQSCDRDVIERHRPRIPHRRSARASAAW
jgi:hypothetical protein